MDRTSDEMGLREGRGKDTSKDELSIEDIAVADKDNSCQGEDTLSLGTCDGSERIRINDTQDNSGINIIVDYNGTFREIQTQENRLGVQPEHYNGIGEWEEYIIHFELCAEIGKWTYKGKALLLGSMLTEGARTFYAGLTSKERRD